ncbi:Putative B3 domain-containing protein Os03g0621600 [Linum grandiflorum]
MAKEGRSESRNDSEESVHFLKVVTGKRLRDKHLMLPKSFTRFYWRNAPTGVTLVLPGHRTWEMEVFKDEKCRVWLRAGWEGFAGFYSLAQGYFLHFTYCGASEFFVRVYSNDLLEIEYPPPPPVPYSSSSPDLDSDSVEESDHQEEEDATDEEEEEDFEEPPTKHMVRRGKEKIVAGHNSSSRQHDKLPFFVATMSATYIKLYQAHIPGKFSKKYIGESDDCVILKMGLKTWDVKLNRHGGKIRYLKLSSGWKQFARDNSLRVGDKCVFQLLEKLHTLVFEVSIVRSGIEMAAVA